MRGARRPWYGYASRMAATLADIGAHGRSETPLERSDRNLVELLQEVRVAQTGVQILFAFLLTVPFTNRFEDLSQPERLVYFLTLLSSGAAAMLLIAPTSWHRLVFQCGDKEHLVKVANRFTIAGLCFVAVAMVGVVVLISQLLFPGLVALLVGSGAAVGCVTCWYVLPLRRRRQLHSGHHRVGATMPRPTRSTGA
jgi:uncharacterized protein DUF6328